MKRFVGIALFAAVALAGPAWAGQDKQEPQLRLELDLADGSRVIGIPNIDSLPVETPYARMNVPLKQIMTIRMGADHERASLEMQNGDKLKGVVSLGLIKLETAFGKVSVAIEHVKDIRVILGGRVLPAGEGTLAYGGLNWTPWRTLFAVQGDKLVTLPRARPGFQYGHGGNGRGATLVANIGSAEWKNYSLEVEYCMSGVNPEFNPYGLPLDCQTGGIMFHLVDLKESWNESGWSTYILNFYTDGSWDLGCMYNAYCHVPFGHGDWRGDGERKLAAGKGLKHDLQNGDKIQIDVHGTRIQVWVHGDKIADVQDEKMPESIGGKTLDHGGVGFCWSYDTMGWIRNMSIKPL